jgi:lysophospholipase L1-like esterase
MQKHSPKNGIAAETPARPKKAPLTFYIFMALLPLLFFGLLEASLRIAGCGEDFDQWKQIGNKYTFNPDFPRRYFSNVKRFPSTLEDTFDIRKKENSYRVFVLGGSTAAGFPFQPMGSFSRYIRKRLEMNYPDRTVEVVNIAMAAVNSYTLLDLIPGVIEQKPDVILIYAGHNEYYGALGVGSMESLGSSRMVVHAVLYLSRFRTYQCMRDLLRGIVGRMTDQGPATSGTLMARMAKNISIEYDSPVFHQGVRQFAENLGAIIKKCNAAGVPLILGTLTSNVKDQRPFHSVKSTRYPLAAEVFEEARAALAGNDPQQADSLFTLAKDLDGLRFRAPTEINATITELAKKFDIPVVDVDAAFRAAGKGHGVVGDEWMTDHLHPTLEGHQVLGKIYYAGMHAAGLLPGSSPTCPYEQQHHRVVADFVITELDRKIGAYSIAKLKNDWPFIHPGEKKRLDALVPIDTPLDRLSLQVANHEKKWVVAHTEMAKTALNDHDMDGFLRHMDVLIYQYPATKESYDLVIHELLKSGRLSESMPYLQQRYRLGSNAYLAKWIGIIMLAGGDGKNALPYLEESISLDPDDPQVLYNLCGGYLYKNQFEKAARALRKCLEMDPDFPGAKDLLEKIINR